MRILISVAVWGPRYGAIFSEYSLASQLSPHNLPRLAGMHDVTYHIITTTKDRKRLIDCPSVKELERIARIRWDCMEDHGICPNIPPRGFDDRKYPFLSYLQNFSFAISHQYDAIVFNYADFVWANRSLSNAIDMLGHERDAVLSFCLPVDQPSAMRALDRGRTNRHDALDLPPRNLASIAVSHLHREAKLRFWNAPQFTTTPTYLLWPVETQGLLIRAYHQTVLALRVRNDDPEFHQGIARGTLDGHFASSLLHQGRITHATDSDEVLVVSLHQTIANSVLRGEPREESLRRLLKDRLNSEQRRMAEVPIRVKSHFTNAAAWEQTEHDSLTLIQELAASTPFDQGAQDRTDMNKSDLESSLHIPSLARRIYQYVLVRLGQSLLGAFLKRNMGYSVRRWKLTLERWIYREKK